MACCLVPVMCQIMLLTFYGFQREKDWIQLCAWKSSIINQPWYLSPWVHPNAFVCRVCLSACSLQDTFVFQSQNQYVVIVVCNCCLIHHCTDFSGVMLVWSCCIQNHYTNFSVCIATTCTPSTHYFSNIGQRKEWYNKV